MRRISSCVACRSSSARVGKLEVVEPGRLLEPVEVLAVAEDGRPALGLVAADALEDAGPVVEPMAEHVDLGVLPAYELPVVPDQLGRLHAHRMPDARRTGYGTLPIGILQGPHLSSRLGADRALACGGEVGGAQARSRARHRRPPRSARHRRRGRGRGGASSPPRGRSRAGWRCPARRCRGPSRGPARTARGRPRRRGWPRGASPASRSASPTRR